MNVEFKSDEVAKDALNAASSGLAQGGSYAGVEHNLFGSFRLQYAGNRLLALARPSEVFGLWLWFLMMIAGADDTTALNYRGFVLGNIRQCCLVLLAACSGRPPLLSWAAISLLAEILFVELVSLLGVTRPLVSVSCYFCVVPLALASASVCCHSFFTASVILVRKCVGFNFPIARWGFLDLNTIFCTRRPTHAQTRGQKDTHTQPRPTHPSHSTQPLLTPHHTTCQPPLLFAASTASLPPLASPGPLRT